VVPLAKYEQFVVRLNVGESFSYELLLAQGMAHDNFVLQVPELSALILIIYHQPPQYDCDDTHLLCCLASSGYCFYFYLVVMTQKMATRDE
jgi:hypothetical protein